VPYSCPLSHGKLWEDDLKRLPVSRLHRSGRNRDYNRWINAVQKAPLDKAYTLDAIPAAIYGLCRHYGPVVAAVTSTLPVPALSTTVNVIVALSTKFIPGNDPTSMPL
jgi:hypothetical protein